jgi:hypothetical protein
MQQIQITKETARKVLTAVAPGLTSGLGRRAPGEMCVEAAVCYALGLPHGADPQCVSENLRSLVIRLNDFAWSSNLARAHGMRRLALAQLGSKGHLDEKEFSRRLVDHAIRVTVPKALRAAASVISDETQKAALCAAADKCEKEGTEEAVYAARSAADAADATYAHAATYAAAYAHAVYTYADAAAYAAHATYNAKANAARKYGCKEFDEAFAEYAEDVVQILIDMKAPGCQWLYLTEAA